MTQPPEPFFGRSQASDAHQRPGMAKESSDKEGHRSGEVRPESGQRCIREAIRSVWPPQRWGEVRVIVGVSGGADSVALARAMGQIADSYRGAGNLVLAHFNHRLRGAASDQDEQFVERLAKQLRCKCVVQRQSADESSGPITDEATLAKIRQDFLVDTAKSLGARYIALAHHRDDNVETFTHHLLRGTGPTGLCGMPAFRSIHSDLVLARPLLAVTREDLRAYLATIKQSFRDDATNHENVYTRNWIRNTLLPTARDRFPHTDEALSRLMATITQWRELIDRLADDWLDGHLISKTPIVVRCDRSGDAAVIVVAMQRLWEQCGIPRRAMNQPHWQAIASCILGIQDECPMLPGGTRVVVENDRVRFDSA